MISTPREAANKIRFRESALRSAENFFCGGFDGIPGILPISRVSRRRMVSIKRIASTKVAPGISLEKKNENERRRTREHGKKEGGNIRAGGTSARIYVPHAWGDLWAANWRVKSAAGMGKKV